MFKVESTNQDICKGDTFNITCSAEGSPAVHTYQLFEDGVLVQTSNNHSGLFWNKETTVGGMLLYTCDANNTVSTAITTRNVTVNGEENYLRDFQFFFMKITVQYLLIIGSFHNGNQIKYYFVLMLISLSTSSCKKVETMNLKFTCSSQNPCADLNDTHCTVINSGFLNSFCNCLSRWLLCIIRHCH